MKQQLITSNERGDFDRAVNAALRDGWKVVAGTMAIAVSQVNYSGYADHQPMRVQTLERYAVVVEKI